MKLTANGYVATTMVSGTAWTGLYAADGSINIVIRTGTHWCGLYHACGAFNVVVVSGSTHVGVYHACGALNVILGQVPGKTTHASGALQVSNADISVILLETGDTLLLETGSAVALDTAIPAQTEATSLTGTEWTVIVQGGTTKKVSVAILAEYING